MPPLKIAACGPLSGPRSAYGDMLKSSVQQVLGNLDNVSLHFFDDEANPDRALLVARQIVESGFDLVVGHFNSYCSLAVNKIYLENQTAFVAPLATHQDLNLARGGAIFCPSDEEQVAIVSAKAKQSDAHLVVVHDDSTYSDNFIDLVKRYQPEADFLSVRNANEFKSQSKRCVVFMTGSHYRLIPAHRIIRSICNKAIIICCDDCFIDEYVSDVSDCLTQNDFVIGQRAGHLGTLELSLGYIRQLIKDPIPEVTLFNRTGKDTGNFFFRQDGRLKTNNWLLRPLSALTAAD